MKTRVLLAVLLAFVVSVVAGMAGTYDPRYDGDGDGAITAADRATAVAYYDANMGASNVTPTPEPTAVPTGTPDTRLPAVNVPLAPNGNDIPIDSQVWWDVGPDGRGQRFGHLHLFTNWPYVGRSITSDFTLPLRLTLHMNPGQITHVRAQMQQGSDTFNVGVGYVYFNPPLTMANAASTGGVVADGGDTVHWQVGVPIDISDAARSGPGEVRLSAFMDTTDGNLMFESTSLPFADVVNGKERTPYAKNQNEMSVRGWYSGPKHGDTAHEAWEGYQRFDIFGAQTWYTRNNPASGTITHRVQLVRGGSSEDIPDEHIVALDADFHHGLPGTILRRGPGQFDGTVSIDTTRLQNGWHRIVGFSITRKTFNGSEYRGGGAYFFYVQNP